MTALVAADIGGTHARFALAEVADGTVVSLGEPVMLKTADHSSLQSAWQAFAAQLGAPPPRSAAIAIACPVQGEVLHLTNNPWTLRPGSLGDELGLDSHLLVNDFEAVAHAVAHAAPGDFRHICGPDTPLPDTGVSTIVGPGTGLGVAALLREGGRTHVIATEGGHIDFAPRDATDDAILAALRRTHGRVSVERVVAGAGLRAIHDVLADAAWAGDDPSLWAAALDGSEPLASAALDRFRLNLGSIAGDLALAQGANAVVIAGGLGARLADHLPRLGFAERFAAKGRFQAMMARIPVKLITHSQPGLFGAAAAFATRVR